MPRFYNRESEFAPTYGDLDWRAVLAAKLALIGEGIEPKRVWFNSDDGLDQECSQENTDVYISKASDDMDVVLVHDPRDEMRYSFFRSGLGTEAFDRITQSLQEVGAAAVHFTLYPQKEIVEMWVKQNTGDNSGDFIPEDW
jgi:hypothetical protein